MEKNTPNFTLIIVLITLLILYIGYNSFKVFLFTSLKLYTTYNSVEPGFFGENRVNVPYLLIPISIIPTSIIEENILLVKAFLSSVYLSAFNFTG